MTESPNLYETPFLVHQIMMITNTLTVISDPVFSLTQPNRSEKESYGRCSLLSSPFKSSFGLFAFLFFMCHCPSYFFPLTILLHVKREDN